MSVVLLPHNEIAYDNVKELHNRGDRAAVIHPTGSGKTYIFIKLVEDNQDKKILYLSPRDLINHQIKEKIIEAEGKMYRNVDRMTYQKLSAMSEEERAELDYDIIVLDEFHHCGSPIWGNAVRELIDNNPGSKVLGLSATPIRYFDGNVDMAEELFGGNIASEMTFREAVDRGILPEFDYVSALYGYDESLRELKEEIDNANVADSKKVEAYKLYEELKTELGDNVIGLPELLAKHMPNKSGKCIVFCKNVEDMKQKMQEAKAMFAEVNDDLTIYSVSAYETEKKNRKTIDAFKKDNNPESLKVMFAVDMLNEGYDMPDIDYGLFLRPTQSPTVYQQQMGRTIRNGGKRATILDLVDNFSTIEVIEDFTKKMKGYEANQNPEERESKGKERVRVYDYTKKAREIIEKIEKLSRRQSLTIEEKIQLFEKYQKEVGAPIVQDTIYEGYPIGMMITQIRRDLFQDENHYDKDIIAKLKDLGLLEQKVEKIENRIDRLINFVKNNQALWYSKDIHMLRDVRNIEEIKKLKKQLEIAKKDYEYIRVRTSKGKLSQEDIKRLKEAGVGGVFGTQQNIKELSEKYDIEIEDLQKIIIDFGSVEVFREVYKQYMYFQVFDVENSTEEQANKYIEMLPSQSYMSVDEKLIFDDHMEGQLEYYIRKLGKKIVKRFDLRESDIGCSDGVYDSLQKTIFGKITMGLIIDGETEKIIFEKAFKNLSEREADVLRKRFGLEEGEWGKQHTLEQVASIYQVNRERIRQIEAKALRRLRHPSVNRELKKLLFNEIDYESKIRFIEIFFENHDVFYSSEVHELDENTKKELKEIYDKGREDKQKENSEKETIKQMMVDEAHRQAENISIEELGLSVRTYNGINRIGCETLKDILGKSEDELIGIRNLGDRSRKELIDKIHSLGFKFDFELKGEGLVESEVATTKEEANLDEELLSIIEELQSTYEELKRQNEKYEELKSILFDKMEELKSEKATPIEKQEMEEKREEIKRRVAEMDIDL